MIYLFEEIDSCDQKILIFAIQIFERSYYLISIPALSEEITLMTLSDIPADPPQNISLEAASSTSIIVRWEPPPKESQNGIITGYKIRWRPEKNKGHSDMITTDGSRRLYALTGLKKDREYQIKLAAMTVNGTGPATSWMLAKTLEEDLDESIGM